MRGTFDRFDFSPVRLEDGRKLPWMKFVEEFGEVVVPPCIANVRRLTHILIGSSMMMGSPISVMAAWRG